jgi:hypothetical protein
MSTHYRMVTLPSPTSHFGWRTAAAQIVAVGELLNVGPIRGRPPRPGLTRLSSRADSAVAGVAYQATCGLRRSAELVRPAQPRFGLATLRRSPEVSAISNVSFR